MASDPDQNVKQLAFNFPSRDHAPLVPPTVWGFENLWDDEWWYLWHAESASYVMAWADYYVPEYVERVFEEG